MAIERVSLGYVDDTTVLVRHVTDPINGRFVLCGEHTIYLDPGDPKVIHIPRVDCWKCANEKE